MKKKIKKLVPLADKFKCPKCNTRLWQKIDVDDNIRYCPECQKYYKVVEEKK